MRRHHHRRRNPSLGDLPWGWIAGIGGAAVVAGAVYMSTQNKKAALPSAGKGFQLLPGQSLTPGNFLRSQNGAYTLVLQTDGNLVLYPGTPGSGPSLWASGTNGQNVAIAIMQPDGNFVLYGATTGSGTSLQGSQGSVIHGSKVPSNTDGHPGAYIILQNDGNLVIYASQGNVGPLWSTGTNQNSGSTQSSANQVQNAANTASTVQNVGSVASADLSSLTGGGSGGGSTTSSGQCPSGQTQQPDGSCA